MKNLKFRIWDKVENKYIFITKREDYDWLAVAVEHPELYNVQQFTGLLDKQSKEIYEGDILGGIYGGGYISWCEKCKQFQYFGCKDECFACGGDVHWSELLVEEELEVIGNIHDNPELIN